MTCPSCNTIQDDDKWIEIQIGSKGATSGFIGERLGGIALYACPNCGAVRVDDDTIRINSRLSETP